MLSRPETHDPNDLELLQLSMRSELLCQSLLATSDIPKSHAQLKNSLDSLSMPRIMVGQKLLINLSSDDKAQILSESSYTDQKGVVIQLSDIELIIENSIKNLLSKHSMHLDIPIHAFEVNLK
jgi:hypothetical protein